MNHHSLLRSGAARRTGALVAATALAAAGLAAQPTPSLAAAADSEQYDAAPAAAGADWLSGQLTDGLVHNDEYAFDDIGLSVDVALALDAVGGHDDTVVAIVAAAEESLPSYIGEDPEQYAGATAKAALLAELVDGGDARSYGGTDLIERLEGLTSEDGRIADQSQWGDYANALGQAYAVRALESAGSTEAAAATGALLEQQCAAGYFLLDLGKSCDAEGASADTDVTAVAVLSLLPQTDGLLEGTVDTAVEQAVVAAIEWLAGNQAGDGSFGGGSSTEAPNTNSTGLAGWALGAAGRIEPAERAAAWVRAQQLGNAGVCTPYRAADLGAVAYDRSGLTAARKDGIDSALRDQFRRASAQAVPALRWTPAEPVDSYIVDDFDRFERAGTRLSPVFGGFPTGSKVCVTLRDESRLTVADDGGYSGATFRLPGGTARRVFTAMTESGESFRRVYRVLDRLDVPVKVKKAVVRRGARQVLKIRGLERGESYRVFFRGKRVDAGTVRRPTTTVRFPVTGKLGKAKVRVVGEFGNRKAVRTFRVKR